MLLHHAVSRMQENTMHSTPSWQIKRSGVAQHGGSHRWDDAYQLLLHWVTAAEVEPPPPPIGNTSRRRLPSRSPACVNM